jgi:TolB-like protein
MIESSKALFLSYASEDATAALDICATLRDAGIEVWLDQSELRGGDTWDQKIRRQIRSCALFMPLISTHTRSRTEGYFRLEWKLAIDRSYLMAPEHAFLVPVTIDGSGATDSTVPERFREVQWTQLQQGRPTPEFVAHITQLLEGASSFSSGTQLSNGQPAPRPREPQLPVADKIGEDGIAGIVSRLREHKILQWALAYLGAAITIAHGEELLAHAFAWDDAIARWLLAILVAGFPVAIGLAWYHGHKGLKRVSQGELMVSSILLVIAGVLLTVLVRPSHISSDAARPPTAQIAPSAPASAPSANVARDRVPHRPRIAVMPFENLSSDANNAFFTDGVHEEILTELANHAPGLDVISSTTMSTYRGKPVTVQTLSRELDCNYVLEGSMQREGSEVRLTLQLIDARNDTHVWAQDYDRKLVSAMALEREVAAAVASQLSLKFAGSAQGEALAANPIAYDFYLKARALETDALATESEPGMEQARQLLDQSIAADPQFARAYLERMSLRLQLFLNNSAQPDAMLPPAQADLAAAQRLAPSDPVVTGYAGVMAYALQDYDHALMLFEQAESVGLADPELLDWKDNLLFAMGRYPEAAALSARLADLDPRNESAQVWRIYMLMELHQYADALQLADTEHVRDPTNPRGVDERDEVLAYAGGNFRPRNAELEPLVHRPLHTPQDVQRLMPVDDMELTLQRRFKELRALFDASPVEDWRSTYYIWPLYRVGRLPLAEQRGWTDLMLGDSAQSSLDGGRILSYLQRTPETAWNGWLRDLLRADAELFMGDGAAANRMAAAAVSLTRAKPDVSDQMIAYVWSTEILAWTDRRDEAVQRLVELSTSIPGLWPGEIVNDPKYSLPLAGHPGYRALIARLNEQMAALQLR